MILLVHLLFGSAIGSAVQNIPLAIVLAFFGHYFLDIFPHAEYDIQNINKKQWREKLPVILEITLDFCIGILIISLFSKNYLIIYICAFFSILPDGLTVLSNLFTHKTLETHNKLHQKTHFLKNKKISNFWRILSQAIVVVIAIIMLRV